MISQEGLKIFFKVQKDKTCLTLPGSEGVERFLFTSSGEVVSITNLSEARIAQMHSDLENHKRPVLELDTRPSPNSIGVGLIVNSDLVAIGARAVQQKVGPVVIDVTPEKVKFTF